MAWMGSWRTPRACKPTWTITQHGLRPIHVETVAGSIYVCLAERPPPFDAFRDHVGPLLAPHNLGNAKLAFESTLVERANWKLVMENARECYHCAVRHPELAITFPVRGRRPVQFADVQRFDRFRSECAVGLTAGPVEGDWWNAMRFPLNDGAVTLSMDGKPACTKLLCETAGGDIGSMRWALEPHCFAHATSDVVFMFSAMPPARRRPSSPPNGWSTKMRSKAWITTWNG